MVDFYPEGCDWPAGDSPSSEFGDDDSEDLRLSRLFDKACDVVPVDVPLAAMSSLRCLRLSPEVLIAMPDVPKDCIGT